MDECDGRIDGLDKLIDEWAGWMDSLDEWSGYMDAWSARMNVEMNEPDR